MGNGTEVLVEKYAKDGERSIREVRTRVAKALAGNENEDRRAFWEAKFLEAQENGFIPAGRINSAAGTSLTATLINCFVQPVGDSITEIVDGLQAGDRVLLSFDDENVKPGVKVKANTLKGIKAAP